MTLIKINPFILLISIVLAMFGKDQHRDSLRGNKFYLKTASVLLIDPAYP